MVMMKKIEKVSFNYKGKNFRIKINICNNFEKITGLMFKTKENANALLFDFKKPVNMKIHSIFVFFPFIAIWLDRKNKVIEIKKVKPFKISLNAERPFAKIIEIPINKKYSKIVKLLLSRRRLETFKYRIILYFV